MNSTNSTKNETSKNSQRLSELQYEAYALLMRLELEDGASELELRAADIILKLLEELRKHD